MNGRDRFTAPPPSYVVVEGGARQRGVAPADRTHDRLRTDRLSGTIGLGVTTVDPIHIGAGGDAFLQMREGAVVARAMLRFNGRPVIPGSSLKGSIRSLAEVLAGGCGLDSQCKGCITCSLFGHANNNQPFAARVGFDDAVPAPVRDGSEPAPEGLSRLPVAWAPRLSRGRRIYKVPTSTPNGPVPYEVVAPGALFVTRMRIVNLSEAELGLVALCLGMDGTFAPRIGGGKFAGMGRVTFTPTGASLRRGYASPRPERLRADAAADLLKKAMGQSTLPPAAEGTLATIRSAMPAPPRR